jgi:hypothetical protein
MRRVLVILILVTFSAFIFSNVPAIERVSKKDAQTNKEKSEEGKSTPVPEKKESAPVEKQVTKSEPVPGAEQPGEAESKKPQKERGISRILKVLKKSIKEERKDKYDYFIDKNGNGIDDRLEQQGKTEKKTEEKKASSEKKERRRR